MVSAEDKIGALAARIVGFESTISAATTLGDGRSVGQATILVEARIAELEKLISDLTDRNSVNTMIDATIKTAMTLLVQRSEQIGMFQKPMLESKAIAARGRLSDSRSYRPWKRTMVNALEGIRVQARPAIEMLENITDAEIDRRRIRDPKTLIRDSIVDLHLGHHASTHPDLEKQLENFN